MKLPFPLVDSRIESGHPLHRYSQMELRHLGGDHLPSPKIGLSLQNKEARHLSKKPSTIDVLERTGDQNAFELGNHMRKFEVFGAEETSEFLEARVNKKSQEV